jgi:FkbM family methyltransferase
MANPPRKLAFILASTDQGALIVNRFDYKMVDAERGFGVGFMLLNTGSYDAQEVATAVQLLTLRRQHHGDGVVALDCGANIGVFTVEWAKAMTGWGSVLAIEAQERIYYALAGNIALNNCFNARALHAAVLATSGTLAIPVPDYGRPATFGSLELRASPEAEEIGQPVDYSPDRLMHVPAISIDALSLSRLDLLKIDVERMELEVLQGAATTIGRLRPVIIVERLKAPEAALNAVLDGHGYRRFQVGLNIVAVHPSDPVSNHVSQGPVTQPRN